MPNHPVKHQSNITKNANYKRWDLTPGLEVINPALDRESPPKPEF